MHGLTPPYAWFLAKSHAYGGFRLDGVPATSLDAGFPRFPCAGVRPGGGGANPLSVRGRGGVPPDAWFSADSHATGGFRSGRIVHPGGFALPWKAESSRCMTFDQSMCIQRSSRKAGFGSAPGEGFPRIAHTGTFASCRGIRESEPRCSVQGPFEVPVCACPFNTCLKHCRRSLHSARLMESAACRGSRRVQAIRRVGPCARHGLWCPAVR